MFLITWKKSHIIITTALKKIYMYIYLHILHIFTFILYLYILWVLLTLLRKKENALIIRSAMETWKYTIIRNFIILSLCSFLKISHPPWLRASYATDSYADMKICQYMCSHTKEAYARATFSHSSLFRYAHKNNNSITTIA